MLEPFGDNDILLNAILIGCLMDLGAVEAAPVMEAAFRAGRVDLRHAGDWEDVQVDMGAAAGAADSERAVRLAAGACVATGKASIGEDASREAEIETEDGTRLAQEEQAPTWIRVVRVVSDSWRGGECSASGRR